MRDAARSAGAVGRATNCCRVSALLPHLPAFPARYLSERYGGHRSTVVAVGADTHATHGAPPALSRQHERCAQYLAHTFTCADARPNARRGDGVRRRAARVAGICSYETGGGTPTGAQQRWGTALKLVPAHVLACFNALAGRFWVYEPSPRTVATAAAWARGTGPVKGGRSRGIAARFA